MFTNFTVLNFVNTGQTVAEIMIIRFFKMASVCHLGCVCRIFGPPAKHILWSLLVCKICCNPRSSFDIMKLWIFHAFGLKMPIHAPKLRFWGFDHLSGEVYQQNPQRHIRAWKDIMWRIDRQNQSTDVTNLRNQKRQRKKPYVTVENWVFTEAIHISFKFHQRLLSGYKLWRVESSLILAEVIT